MFWKSLIVFGLLAAFSVQGMETSQLDARTVELRGLGDLIEQVTDLTAKLNDIVSGVLGTAVGTLKNLINIVKGLKEKFLNLGLSAISKAIKRGTDFINGKIEEAAKLGINIAKCTVGRIKQLADLATALTGALTDCITKPVTDVLTMINNELKNIGDIIKNIASLPTQLAKCLATLRPISCVTGMVTSLTKLVVELPGQIAKIISDVTTLVDNLSGALGSCVNGITVTVNSKVNAIIDEVGKCADELFPKPILRL